MKGCLLAISILVGLYQPSVVDARESLTGFAPNQLKIPSLSIDAEVTPIGYSELQQIPDDGEAVFWYKDGVNPGGPGHAVMAGHFDDYVGPAIFYSLNELRAGDFMYIVNENDQILTYQVESIDEYERDQAPIDTIFQTNGPSKIKLITCSGYYSKKQRTHTHRLVVTALLVGRPHPYKQITEPSE
ncbi:class F sortase [Bacillus sp. FJAT-45037]|uniref:class F sortase n=1 Tax=Bacillus sp. FJAT-45037 TaxID=2011007 RepID=UPI000C2342DD|nr:class F sortase [Bacillus sp. FJAT-45037]